ncbi:TPA: hypothetical protein K8305_003418 [Escherichia coli]|nr:hypothetical protein [Escherichia coli]HBI8139386.1 hypothetical protein [Escherichia coli]
MGKGSSKGHTPREAKDNLKSTQLLSVIDAISEGPIEGPVDGLKSVLLNSTPVLDNSITENSLTQLYMTVACSVLKKKMGFLLMLLAALLITRNQKTKDVQALIAVVFS